MANLTKEASLVTVSETEIGAIDYVRVLDGASSRKITCTDFADVMDPLLVAKGFLTASSSTSTVEHRNVRSVAASNTILDSDSILLVSTAGGVVGINLPTASSVYNVTTGAGQQFTIKRTTTYLNKITITPPGVETIDGDTAYDLVGPNLVSLTFVSDGSNWFIIS